MNETGQHWTMIEKEYRRCETCKLEEFYDDDEEKWKWSGNEEFMETLFLCEMEK
jgi:hypothetical protein